MCPSNQPTKRVTIGYGWFILVALPLIIALWKWALR